MHITVTGIDRVQIADGYPGYRIRYPHPQTGAEWEHLVPLEAIATRGELLGLDDPLEVMRVILAEAYALDETATPYAAPMSAEAHAVASTLAQAEAGAPVARVLDDAAEALDAPAVDAARASAREQVLAIIDAAEVSVHTDAPGWASVAQALDDDRLDLDRWRALVVASQLAPVAEAARARGGEL